MRRRRVHLLNHFRQFRGHIKYVAMMWNIHENTCRRIYRAWVVGMAFLFQTHQPAAPPSVIQSLTPPRTTSALNLKPDQGVVLGDASERRCPDASDRAIHGAFHSEYKGTTTLKYLLLVLMNGYLHWMGDCFPGAATDNLVHYVQNVCKLVPSGMAYVYDRGISASSMFDEECVTVVVPGKAQKRQRVFSSKSMEKSRNVATERILVERVFEKVREYAGFDAPASVGMLDVAGAEAQAIRGLVNFKRAPSNWADTSLRRSGKKVRKLSGPEPS